MRWFSKSKKLHRRSSQGWRSPLEQLETRALLAADPLPVLMVIADQHDFYYREYSETRAAITAQGIEVVVAATTTNTSYAHANTGQGAGDGGVTPDLALSAVDAEDYSAIVFVGGWGASMYQYAYNDPNGDGITDNYYSHGPYNGDDALGDGQIDPTKIIVNDLIQAFQAQDKHVAAICHGVTVLAWARTDGVSPLSGRHVAVPTTVSSPNQFYENVLHTDGYYLGQYEQVIDNAASQAQLVVPLGTRRRLPTMWS